MVFCSAHRLQPYCWFPCVLFSIGAEAPTHPHERNTVDRALLLKEDPRAQAKAIIDILAKVGRSIQWTETMRDSELTAAIDMPILPDVQFYPGILGVRLTPSAKGNRMLPDRFNPVFA